MHLAFIAPEYPDDQRLFVRALKQLGARVSGIGTVDRRYLPASVSRLLSDYERVSDVEDEDAVTQAARRLDRRSSLDRIEAVHEKQVLAAATAREALGLEGTSRETIRLCRDKWSMKERLREAGIVCAESRPANSSDEARRIVDELGLPVVIKLRQGYGGLETFSIESTDELDSALVKLFSKGSREVVVERLVRGREGFLDSLLVAGKTAHRFLSFYEPGVLEALSRPERAAIVISDNRVEQERFREIRELGERVVEILGLDTGATHLEFFETEDGVYFSEIGARPPGERLWELHALGNDLDLHLEWARALVEGRTAHSASRRFAAGSVQIRPRKPGYVSGYRGLQALSKRFGGRIFARQVLTRGYPSTPLEAGYLGNAWFRLYHPSAETLLKELREIGELVEMRVRGPA